MSIVRTHKFEGNKVGELIVITKPDHYDETLEMCKVNDIGYIVEIDPEDYQRYKVEFTNGETKWISKQTEFVKAVDILKEVIFKTNEFEGNKVGDLIVITKPDHYDETLEKCKVNDVGYIVEIEPDEYQKYKVEFTNGETKWISKQTEFVKAVDILNEVFKNDERVIE